MELGAEDVVVVAGVAQALTLTAQVLAETDTEQPAPVRIADWEEDDEVVVSRAVGTLDEICSDDHADLARLSVGLRVVRTMLATP